MAEPAFLKDFCSIFYEVTNCPICMYDGTACVLSVPGDPFSFQSFHQKDLWEKGEVNYVISNTGLFYARVPVEESDLSLVIGPFLMNFLSERYVAGVMEEYSMIAYPPEIVEDYLRKITSGVFSKAIMLVRFVVFMLTHHLPGPFDLFSASHDEVQSRISEKHVSAVVQSREGESYHNTYELERMIYARVQNGDADYFRNINQSVRYKAGKTADTSLRQAKNLFIINVTLATRAAVAGGLDEEIAYQLSDEYIQTVENMVSLDSIEHLSSSMIIDFTERVQEASLPLEDIPEDIRRSIRYIRLHTNSNLSVQEVADVVKLSRSHLSRKFKEVMGFDISAFMMRCKLEEARSLLLYSQQSIADISNYLCFSSQSYFTNVFRKKYGLTPKEYRLQDRKKISL